MEDQNLSCLRDTQGFRARSRFHGSESTPCTMEYFIEKIKGIVVYFKASKEEQNHLYNVSSSSRGFSAISSLDISSHSLKH